MAEFLWSVTNENGNIPVALEDSIMLKGQPATAGSAMLEGFNAPFDATVVEKLRESELRIVGKTAMDAFSLPDWENGGEEKSDAAACIRAGLCELVFANDLSGKWRGRAPDEGLFYLHPSYGTVSRYGLIPSVSSMDQIGVLGKTAQSCFAALETIAGHDEKDGTSLPQKQYRFQAAENLRYAVPETVWALADEKQKAVLTSFLDGKESVHCALPYFDALSSLQFILSAAEFSNNTNRYDGIKFGHRAKDFRGLNELYLRSRTEGFDKTGKLYSVMGAFVLSQEQYVPYYEQSMRVRALLHQALHFADYDVLILPTKLKDADVFAQSALFAVATLCGLPSLSCPYANGGLQFVAAAGNENALLAVGKGENHGI